MVEEYLNKVIEREKGTNNAMDEIKKIVVKHRTTLDLGAGQIALNSVLLPHP